MPVLDKPRSAKPSALVISPEAPYPLDGGGALRTASLLCYLSSRYQVDLIAFQHPAQEIAESLPPGLVRSCRLIELRHHENTFSARASRNAARLLQGRPPLLDRFSGYDAQIERLLEETRQPYDIALLEHFWSATYLPLVKRFSRRVILDLHNIESGWHAGCADAGGFPRSLIHRAFARAARRFERELLPLCDLALTTSADDARRVQALSPGLQVCIYPNAVPWRDLPLTPPDHAIAFSANMEYEPNRTAVKWFLETIWPAIHKQFPTLVLRLIGKNPNAVAKFIGNSRNVECTGWVEDTLPFLATAQICIAPLRSGSGTRLKIIEAWAAGRPVVSTTKGAEGLGAIDGQSILLADAPDHFADSIKRLLLDPALRQKIAISGRELFEAKFTWNVVWKTLSQCPDGFIE